MATIQLVDGELKNARAAISDQISPSVPFGHWAMSICCLLLLATAGQEVRWPVVCRLVGWLVGPPVEAALVYKSSHIKCNNKRRSRRTWAGSWVQRRLGWGYIKAVLRLVANWISHNKRECYSRVHRLSDTRYPASESTCYIHFIESKIASYLLYE